MAAGLSVLRTAFAGISPRERRLLTALAAVVALVAMVGFYLWSSSALDDIEAERAAALDALRAIRNERPRIRQREAVHQRMLARFTTRAPALTSFVESMSRDPDAPPPAAGTTTGTGAAVATPVAPAAGQPTSLAAPPSTGAGAADAGTANPNDTSVTVAEATDRSSPPLGHFQRRAVAIRLRRVNLQSLVGFMNRIDGAPFPIAITSVRVRKVFGERNLYDVDDMVIATWDRVDSSASNPTRGATPSTNDNGSRSATGAPR